MGEKSEAETPQTSPALRPVWPSSAISHAFAMRESNAKSNLANLSFLTATSDFAVLFHSQRLLLDR